MLKLNQRISPILAISFILGNAAISTALEPGIYWGGGSRYIRIAQQGNRFCYQGTSPNGATVASVLPMRGQPGVYRIYGVNGTNLSQSDLQTLWLGSAPYNRDGDGGLTSELQQCLSSSRPYFWRETFRR